MLRMLAKFSNKKLQWTINIHISIRRKCFTAYIRSERGRQKINDWTMDQTKGNQSMSFWEKLKS